MSDRFCINCRHHRPPRLRPEAIPAWANAASYATQHLCARNATVARDPVTGDERVQWLESCERERADLRFRSHQPPGGTCGPEGRHFEPKTHVAVTPSET